MNYKGKKVYSGIVDLPDDVSVEATITAHFDVVDDPGCMYRRNGDPGDPPYYEEEMTDYEVKISRAWTGEYCREINNFVPNAEQKDIIDNALIDCLEDTDLEVIR